ncbi:hypothetical protein [Listeria booriae]|uniref:Uncharacterized protein n=1 Tax=Listeria booriae TaxID=1552123 RepID=A0A7X0YX18_9LIST|nr:hypothetical protein [Listeria booriae]MBC2149740.1 hypothetical protein [Listeria booriae]MBC2312041.1 hypothetical protein [Listeria booriae]MBC6164673.1 hypothetical protein [Listeria booriae]
MTESKGISTSNEPGGLIIQELNESVSGLTDSLVSAAMTLASIILYIVFGLIVLIALIRIIVWIVYLIVKHPDDPIFPSPIKPEENQPSKKSMQEMSLMAIQTTQPDATKNDNSSGNGGDSLSDC